MMAFHGYTSVQHFEIKPPKRIQASISLRWRCMRLFFLWGPPASGKFITYVDSKKVKTQNPEFCFLKGGFQKLKKKSSRGLRIFATSVDANYVAKQEIYLNGRATDTGGKTWTAHTGNWTITSNTAGISTNVAEAVLTLDAGKSDATVQAKFTNNTANARLVFRFVDTSNLLIVQNDSASKYAMFKKKAGTYTQLGTSAGTAANNDVVKVVLSGSSVTVFVNNTQIMSQTITELQTATKYGLGTNTTAPKFDDFSVV